MPQQYPSSIVCLCAIILLFSTCKKDAPAKGTDFETHWSTEVDRPWAGPEIWLNPLQAWKLKDGRLRCEVSGGDRNATLLTREIHSEKGSFTAEVKVVAIESSHQEHPNDGDNQPTSGQVEHREVETGWVGFQLGMKGEFGDYRDDAIFGRGFCAGLTKKGQLFIGLINKDAPGSSQALTEETTIKIEAEPKQGNLYLTTLSWVNSSGHTISQLQKIVDGSWMPGLIAISCSQQSPRFVDLEAAKPAYDSVPALGRSVGGNTHFAFWDWKISGSKIKAYPERNYGPILWCQYTLSQGILKMSAQFPPIGNDNRLAKLFVDGSEVQEATIDSEGQNALFRLDNWDDTKDHPYEVKYTDNEGNSHSYTGTIVACPQSDHLKVASLSCVDDVGFPHHDVVESVQDHKPDLLVFHGDQIYERVGGYGVERSNTLDYLRKWYIWGWSFRELFRDRPVVIIPDDHDVFHGNLWGSGGKRADVSLGWGYDAQDDGGYKEPPTFVNMVHRTQTSHLPDPYDPAPVENGISVYYTELLYSGVSFAILGDRQWKSAPKALLPEGAIENGWPQNTKWNAKTQAYHPDAELLGDRQMQFLEHWVAEWKNGAVFKTVISQSPFCNVATLPADIYHDKFVPGLPRYRPGEYPADDRPVADFDSNAWPQNKRNDALKVMRKAFALHLVGDQHLASTGRYGIDTFGDAGYWNACPAVSNLWPRRWFPAQEPTGERKNGAPRYAGNYEDGFGNKISVEAVANPYDIDREPGKVYDKAPGYAIIVFDKSTRKIEIANWPRFASPSRQAPDNVPFEGWPLTIAQQDNYGRQPAGYLAEVEIKEGQYVKVFKEATGELEYAWRPHVGVFRPWVYDTKEKYKVEVVQEEP